MAMQPMLFDENETWYIMQSESDRPSSKRKYCLHNIIVKVLRSIFFQNRKGSDFKNLKIQYEKSDAFHIQISHNLLKYRISLSYFVPWVENHLFLRNYYNRLWQIWIWKASVYLDSPCIGHEGCMRVVDKFWTASGFYFVAINKLNKMAEASERDKGHAPSVQNHAGVSQCFADFLFELNKVMSWQICHIY